MRVAEGLRRRGVEASTAYDEQKIGATDEGQLAQAAGLGAVILHMIPTLSKSRRRLTAGERIIAA